MTDVCPSTDRIQDWIERLAVGDDQACAELINHTTGRVSELTRRMFKDFRRLGRWEQTEDISQNASMRLWSAIKTTRPTTAAEFLRLAALQIRRELIDQARHYFGPEGIGANHASNAQDSSSDSALAPVYDQAQSTYDPVRLCAWAEFHEQVALLPDEEQAVFDLVYYQGLSQLRRQAYWASPYAPSNGVGLRRGSHSATL